MISYGICLSYFDFTEYANLQVHPLLVQVAKVCVFSHGYVNKEIKYIFEKLNAEVILSGQAESRRAHSLSGYRRGFCKEGGNAVVRRGRMCLRGGAGGKR